jgi:hypothetical protein
MFLEKERIIPSVDVAPRRRPDAPLRKGFFTMHSAKMIENLSLSDIAGSLHPAVPHDPMIPKRLNLAGSQSEIEILVEETPATENTRFRNVVMGLNQRLAPAWRN